MAQQEIDDKPVLEFKDMETVIEIEKPSGTLETSPSGDSIMPGHFTPITQEIHDAVSELEQEEETMEPELEIEHIDDIGSSGRFGCCTNYDFRGFYCNFWLLILALFILGVSELMRIYEPEFELSDFEFWKWLRIASLIPGVYILGVIIDIVIFVLIDAIGYFERFTTLFVYYMSSFRNLLGHFIAVLLFRSYYTDIVDIERNDIINNITVILLVAYVLMSIRNLIINFVMRKRLLAIFKNNISLVLLYKDIIYNLTCNMLDAENDDDVDKQKKPFDKKTYDHKDVSWKLLKLKNTGFEVLENGRKMQIFKREKMLLIASKIWNYLIKKYTKTDSFKQKYKRIIKRRQTNIKLSRIPADFLLKEININSDNEHYNDIVSLFDPQNDAYITDIDFKDAISKMFFKWRESNTFLVGYNNLSTIFKYLMTCITYFIIVIVGLRVFDVPLSDAFVPLATIIATISFSVSRVISNLAASIVFIIFVEAYGIGHRVSIPTVSGGSNLIVKEINILTTVFRENKSGKIITVPNHELYNANITNHHSSQMVVFNLHFKVSCKTRQNKIDELTQKINDYLELHPNEWKPNVGLYIDIVEHQDNYILLDYWVQHYSHWGNGKIYDSKTELMRYITDVMNELEIEYVNPIQPLQSLDKVKKE